MEGEAGSTHREPDVGFNPGSPGSRPGPKAGAKPLSHPGIPCFNIILLNNLLNYFSFIKVLWFCFFKISFIYSWETQREAETQVEGEAGLLRGAQCGTWSQDPRIMTWAKGRCSATEDTQVPLFLVSTFLLQVYISWAALSWRQTLNHWAIQVPLY